MENLNSTKIQEIIAIIQANLDFQINELQKRSNNLKRINLKLLTNELQIINPKRVLVLGVEGLNTDPIMQQFKGERMSKENYELFVNSLGDKEMMKNPEYQKVKMEFNRMMKFMILGVV
jgi:hypothetical protein